MTHKAPKTPFPGETEVLTQEIQRFLKQHCTPASGVEIERLKLYSVYLRFAVPGLEMSIPTFTKYLQRAGFSSVLRFTPQSIMGIKIFKGLSLKESQ